MARAAYLATSSAEVPSSFALRSSAARVLSSFCFSSAVFKLALSSATIPSFPVSLAYRAASKMSWITVSAAVTSWSLSEASFSKRMRYEVDGGPAVEAAACLASSEICPARSSSFPDTSDSSSATSASANCLCDSNNGAL